MQFLSDSVKREEVYLTKLPFTDLYIRLDLNGVPSRYRPDVTRVGPSSDREGNFEVPIQYDERIDELRAIILEDDQEEGTFTYQGMRMRYVTSHSEKEHWAAIRAIPLDIPHIDGLGLDPEFTEHMKTLVRKKGLIIVGGKTGDGKTTTCVSLLKYFLDKHGGMLITLEDPPEYALQGAVNSRAFCLQYEIKDNDEWGKMAKKAMRSRPDYILFGEIRTPEAAENLLKTLTSGHLVVATIHAGNVADTLSALMQLAENKLGKVARDSLADRLLATVHQTMTSDGPEVKAVIPGVMNDNDRSVIISSIKNGQYDNLSKSAKSYSAKKKRR